MLGGRGRRRGRGRGPAGSAHSRPASGCFLNELRTRPGWPTGTTALSLVRTAAERMNQTAETDDGRIMTIIRGDGNRVEATRTGVCDPIAEGGRGHGARGPVRRQDLPGAGGPAPPQRAPRSAPGGDGHTRCFQEEEPHAQSEGPCPKGLRPRPPGPCPANPVCVPRPWPAPRSPPPGRVHDAVSGNTP